MTGVGSELADVEQQFTLVAAVALLAVASVASWSVDTAMGVLKHAFAR